MANRKRGSKNLKKPNPVARKLREKGYMIVRNKVKYDRKRIKNESNRNDD